MERVPDSYFFIEEESVHSYAIVHQVRIIIIILSRCLPLVFIIYRPRRPGVILKNINQTVIICEGQKEIFIFR
jgi:hypothetical protein